MHLGDGMVYRECVALGVATASVGAGLACALRRRAKRLEQAGAGRAADRALAVAAVVALAGLGIGGWFVAGTAGALIVTAFTAAVGRRRWRISREQGRS